MWRFGPAGLMNCHLVVKWGMRDPTVSARLCWAYLARAKAWARAGKSKLRPQRRSRRYGDAFELFYTYVHEFDSSGMHTHILATIPAASRLAFEAWTRRAVGQLTQCPSVDRKVVKLVPSRERSESSSVDRAWHWVRYCLKQTSADIQWGPPWVPLRTVLKVWPQQTLYRIPNMSLTGASKSLGVGTQKAAGFPPSLLSRQPDRVYSGDELEEWRERQRLAELEPLVRTLTL